MILQFIFKCIQSQIETVGYTEGYTVQGGVQEAEKKGVGPRRHNNRNIQLNVMCCLLSLEGQV